MCSVVNPSSMNLNTANLSLDQLQEMKQDLKIVLCVMDIDLAQRVDEPPVPAC